MNIKQATNIATKLTKGVLRDKLRPFCSIIYHDGDTGKGYVTNGVTLLASSALYDDSKRGQSFLVTDQKPIECDIPNFKSVVPRYKDYPYQFFTIQIPSAPETFSARESCRVEVDGKGNFHFDRQKEYLTILDFRYVNLLRSIARTDRIDLFIPDNAFSPVVFEIGGESDIFVLMPMKEL